MTVPSTTKLLKAALKKHTRLLRCCSRTAERLARERRERELEIKALISVVEITNKTEHQRKIKDAKYLLKACERKLKTCTKRVLEHTKAVKAYENTLLNNDVDDIVNGVSRLSIPGGPSPN
jgi:hypothetical protein